LLTRIAAIGEEIVRCRGLPSTEAAGGMPYIHLPAVFDLSLFSFSLTIPSQYWHDTVRPPAIRGIICAVPQPGDSGCATAFSRR